MKIMELTKRLSSFAKGGRPVKKMVRLDNFLKETVDAFLFNYDVAYEVKTAKDLWEVEMDELQISHVIEHVLKNAIEANSGDVTITVEAMNMKVYEEESHHEISLQHGEYVVISIADDGLGIEKDIIDKIFDPYFTTKDFASGMGLAASYAIIKRHRGYINVKSHQGNGTVFYVYLPVKR